MIPRKGECTCPGGGGLLWRWMAARLTDRRGVFIVLEFGVEVNRGLAVAESGLEKALEAHADEGEGKAGQ
jgi:hypothetical protein